MTVALCGAAYFIAKCQNWNHSTKTGSYRSLRYAWKSIAIVNDDAYTDISCNYQHEIERDTGIPSTSAAAHDAPHGPPAAAAPGRTVSKDMVMAALIKHGMRLTPGSEPEKVLAKQTHLHLNGHKLSKLSRDLPRAVPKLQVLYLYDNLFQGVDGVSSMTKLTHLYLQNNEISDMSGIRDLPNLAKLYLGVSSLRDSSSGLQLRAFCLWPCYTSKRMCDMQSSTKGCSSNHHAGQQDLSCVRITESPST